MKSRRGAALVMKRPLSTKNIRLPLVHLGHLPAALREPRFDFVDDRLIDVEFETERLRERVARQVVFGGTEAAGDDEDVGVIERDVDLVDDIIEYIADHAL